MNIIEYKTATGATLPELDKEVNKLLKQGFQPYGNLFFSTWDIPDKADTYGFFQSMVKVSGVPVKTATTHVPTTQGRE
jgi:hypothetical protein